MSPDDSISLDLLPEEVRENRPDEFMLPASTESEDPQFLLRRAVIRLLASRNDPTGVRDSILDTVEETVLRYFVDSGRYSQRELANLLSLSRVTLRKKLGRYGIS
ncbi:MAG: hypothetical protein JXR49_07045 [Acidobacteria bacterium]|nr:hypothetical protein [Acidobacteriota bacterium]